MILCNQQQRGKQPELHLGTPRNDSHEQAREKQLLLVPGLTGKKDLEGETKGD